jgi:hypothetical protein
MKVELVNGGVWQSFEKIDVEIEKMRSNGSGFSKILAALEQVCLTNQMFYCWTT